MDAILPTHPLLFLICACCVPFLAFICKDLGYAAISGQWQNLRLRCFGLRMRFRQAVYGGPDFIVINSMFFDLTKWHLNYHNGEFYLNYDGRHGRISVHIPVTADVQFEWK